MKIAEIRAEVMNMYPHSLTWHRRVSRMPENQVYAIYRDNQERKHRPVLEEEKKTSEEWWPMFHQYDIWEWLNAKEVNNV